MKGAHRDYRGRAAKANAPRPFFLALSAILLAAEFVFMQELCAVALDVENAVVVVVVALGATAATPILMNLAAGCFSDYAAAGGRDRAALGIVAIGADAAFIAVATWFRWDCETAQASVSESGGPSLLERVSSSLEALGSPEATTALMTAILVAAGIASFIAAYTAKDAALARMEMACRRAMPSAEGTAYAAAATAYWEGIRDRRLEERARSIASLSDATVALACAESLLGLVGDPADASVIAKQLDELLDLASKEDPAPASVEKGRK